MALYATNGTKIYIGGVLSPKSTDFIATDFAAQTWVEIGGTEALGSVGDQAEIITSKQIAQQRVKKMKGSRDGGEMEVVAAIDYADAGQSAIVAAEKTSSNYAIRVVLNDAPVGGTPSERLFIALVSQAREQLDTADSIVKLNMSFAVNSNIVRVDAAA